MKPWYLSKTIWGAIFVALATILPAIPALAPYAETATKVLEFIGTLFFGVGVRSAIAANGVGR